MIGRRGGRNSLWGNKFPPLVGFMEEKKGGGESENFVCVGKPGFECLVGAYS